MQKLTIEQRDEILKKFELFNLPAQYKMFGTEEIRVILNLLCTEEETLTLPKKQALWLIEVFEAHQARKTEDYQKHGFSEGLDWDLHQITEIIKSCSKLRNYANEDVE